MTVLFAVILANCAGPVTPTVVPSSTPEPIQSTNTAIPTTTLTLAPTPKPTKTPTVGESIVVEQKCMEPENLPQDLKLSGVWIRNPASPYLENLTDNTKYSIPLKGGGKLDSGWKGNMTISPDGKLLAYLDGFINKAGRATDKWEFRIIKSNGQFLPLKDWTFDTREIIGWANNNEIILKIYSSGQKYIVYDPFTGEKREIIIDKNIINFPFETEDIISEWNTGDYFNPDKIVFYTRDGNQFYDVSTWKRIINIDLGYASELAWSPDLSTLLVAPYIDGNQDNLYIIQNDKVFLKLNLAVQGYEGIIGYDWSPNSKKFLVGTTSKIAMTDKTAIMDLETLQVTVLCINGEKIEQVFRSYNQPAWSPDGRFLIYSYYGENSDGEGGRNFLIDTEQWRAYKLVLKYDSDIIGWLANP